MPIKGFDEFKKKFGKLSKQIIKAMDNAAKEAAYTAEREMKKNIKQNKSVYTGRLWDSMRSEQIRPMVWGVGSQVKYQWYLEYGTRPHRPPFKPIFEWARLKNKLYGESGKAKAYLLAKAVMKTIETKGTKPHPFIRPAFETVKGQFSLIIEKHLKKVKRSIGG